MTPRLLLISALAVAGCTTMAPHADQVAIVTDPLVVEKCTAMGNIVAEPPYVMPGDDLKQLQNQATGLGADTVLRTSPRVLAVHGVAYRCRS
jgi:hypothetical protein